jgi:hypothetical protein
MVGVSLVEQERRIARATVKPCLASTADRIAVVVEARCPASCPTRKGLIQEDVAASTEELKRQIQSLEGKLVQAKNVKGNGKKTKKTTKGTAITQANTKPTTDTTPKSKAKSKSSKKSNKKSAKKPTTKPTPAAKGNNLRSDAKRNARPSSKSKLCGKGREKSTAACK